MKGTSNDISCFYFMITDTDIVYFSVFIKSWITHFFKSDIHFIYSYNNLPKRVYRKLSQITSEDKTTTLRRILE